jgi:hypothetical protein
MNPGQSINMGVVVETLWGGGRVCWVAVVLSPHSSIADGRCSSRINEGGVSRSNSTRARGSGALQCSGSGKLEITSMQPFVGAGSACIGAEVARSNSTSRVDPEQYSAAAVVRSTLHRSRRSVGVRNQRALEQHSSAADGKTEQCCTRAQRRGAQYMVQEQTRRAPGRAKE